MSILAIDPSLTGTGYAWRGQSGNLYVGSLVQRESRSLTRLHTILEVVKNQARQASSTLLVIEGYAMNVGRSGRVFDIGELGGIIKYALWERGHTIMVVPPNSLKLFMLGRYKTVGVDSQGAKVKLKVKDLVQAAAEEHAGRAFATNDQADAYSLLLMGEAYRDSRLLPRLRTHYKRAAMAGCDIILPP